MSPGDLRQRGGARSPRDGPWERFWEACSAGDDAYIGMCQEGDRVVGTYFSYNGRLEVIAENGVLRGPWTSPNGSGTFSVALTVDGQSFSGTIGSGEWWNGRRIDEEDIGMEHWDTGGSERVRSTIDFSAVSEKLRDWRLVVVATSSPAA